MGAPRRRYRDQLKQQLHVAWAGIDHCNWQMLALERSMLETLTKRAVQNFEEGRVQLPRKSTDDEKRRPVKHLQPVTRFSPVRIAPIHAGQRSACTATGKLAAPRQDTLPCDLRTRTISHHDYIIYMS